MSLKLCQMILSRRATQCNFKRTLKTKVKTVDGHKIRVRNEEWISTIGLEVHAQLKTETKLFSRALSAGRGRSAGPVNTNVLPFDASIPGTLPVLNKKCVNLATKAALALKCDLNKVSTFDRKHYFYADLPAGYQITQQRKPIASNGRIDFTVLKSTNVAETYEFGANIVQLQLEQV